MSTNYEFKKIGDVDIIESINDFAHVIIEDSGVLKKMAAKNIGAVKTVNGSAPDADGNVQIEVEAGASSWNDLTDKPFYDAGTEVQIPVFNLEVNSDAFEEDTSNTGSNVYVYQMDDSTVFSPEADVTYDVNINGESYSATAFEAMEGMAVLGNLSIMVPTFNNTGEPFVIGFGEIITTISAETYSITISKVTTAIEKEIKAEASVTFTDMNDMAPLLMNMTDFDFSSISEGDTIIVSVDGVQYINTVRLFEGIPVFGNIGMIGMIGEPSLITDEPYLGMYAMGMSGMYFLPPKLQVTLSIDKILEDSNYQNIFTNKIIDTNNDFEKGAYIGLIDDSIMLEPNIAYRVTINGREYSVTSTSDGSLECRGNTDILYINAYNDALHLIIERLEEMSSPVTSNIKISGYVSGVKKLDKKYLPDHEHEINLPIASGDELGCVKISGYRTSNSDGSELSTSGYYSEIYIDSKTDKIYTKAPKIHMSMTDLIAGVSSLESGKIYLVYE